jgi:hypothetical protein
MQIPKGFKSTSEEHAVLTQYHRWFQFYEDEIDLHVKKIENQLSLLQEDVHVTNKAYNSKVIGHAKYLERMPPLLGWKNSHRVVETKVTPVIGGYELRAAIIYTNKKPDGTSNTVRIEYEALLLEKGLDKGVLPMFHFVTLKNYTPLELVPFHDQYTDNRAKSFMHYWCYLMELSSLPSDRFDQVLDKDSFVLDMTQQKITTRAQMREWAEGSTKRIAMGAHTYKDFSAVKLDNGQIQVKVKFDWTGVNTDSKFQFFLCIIINVIY